MELHTAEVDLQGLLTVLAENLYSTPEVALRELVQNAHDSTVRRRLESDAPIDDDRIEVVADPTERILAIHDRGAGLTDDEIRSFLATIGAGYTRLLRARSPEEGLIGAFGLGFLSAYVVSERVEVRTTSFREPHTTWRFVSRDGRRYSLETGEPRDIGTTVRLHLKAAFAHLADPVRVRRLLARYGSLLPVAICAPDRVNPEPPPWRRSFDSPFLRRKAERELAERFEPVFHPLATAPIDAGPGADVRGVFWVQDGTSYATSDTRHVSLFVRGMLITDDARKLLPDWAGFLGAVFESDALVPTASREDVQRDAAFGRIAAHVAEQVVTGLRRIAEEQPAAWRTIHLRHNEALRGAALADARLFELLRDAITVPTTEGDLTMGEVLERSGGQVVMSSGEESGTEEVLFRAIGKPVVRGSRFGAAPFTRRFAEARGVPVVVLGAGSDGLFPAVFIEPEQRRRLDAMLGREDVELVVTRFAPASLPVLLVPDRDVELKRRIEDDAADRRIAKGLLSLARGFTSTIEPGAVARLYVNLDAPLVQRMLAADGPTADALASVVGCLAELAGRSALPGVSRDLGAVLDAFSAAVIRLSRSEGEHSS